MKNLRGRILKLSTITRYGLSALSDLCAHYKNDPVSVNDIAMRQKIPVNYLERLFSNLRKAEILISVRGAQGGYKLARPADKITISEIMRALGEPVIFGNCQTENGCENANLCPAFDLWKRVKNSVDEILTNIKVYSTLGETVTFDESDTHKSLADYVSKINSFTTSESKTVEGTTYNYTHYYLLRIDKRKYKRSRKKFNQGKSIKKI